MSGGVPSTGNDRGTGQQSSPQKGKAGGSAGPLHPNGQRGASGAPQGISGGSSPLVPILIAILALAAISIGAVLIRQRRHGGTTVSPGTG